MSSMDVLFLFLPPDTHIDGHFAHCRLCLQEDVREANSEQGEISSRTIKALRELLKPTSSNTDGTVEKDRIRKFCVYISDSTIDVPYC